MAVALIAMTAFSQWFLLGALSNYLQVGCLMIFVAGFEFSWGPIVWLYLAEVCTDKGISYAILANWTMSLLIGYLTPYFLNFWLMNYTFLFFGGFCFLATLFTIFIMKETKGKTELECLELYSDLPNEDNVSYYDDNDDFLNAN